MAKHHHTVPSDYPDYAAMPIFAVPPLGRDVKSNRPYFIAYPNGCWPWQGALTNGYATATIKDKSLRVHRWMAGITDPELSTDHLCRNRKCVRPSHLDAVTQAVNNERMRDHIGLKTHCIHGHEFTEENTRHYTVRAYIGQSYRDIKGGPRRLCLTCYRRTLAEARARRRRNRPPRDLM